MPTDPIDNHPDPGHRSPRESPITITQNHRDQQRAFQCATEEIAGGASSCTSDPASFGVEVGNLESWARDKGTLFPDAALDLLPLVSNSPQQHECITMMKSTDLPPKTHLDLESLWSSVLPIRKSIAVQKLSQRTFLGILSPRFRKETQCPLYRDRKTVLDDGTRLDHTLAVSRLALKISLQMELPHELCRYAAAWGLVHDIATWPLSHTGEAAFSRVTGVSGRQLREMMISADPRLPKSMTIREELEKSKIDPAILFALFDKANYPKESRFGPLWRLVNSPLTPDSLEGIWRCARCFKITVKNPESWSQYFSGGGELFPAVPRGVSRKARHFWEQKSTVYNEFINREDVVFFESGWSEAITMLYGECSLVESLSLQENEMISEILNRGVVPSTSVVRYKQPLAYKVTLTDDSKAQMIGLDELHKVFTKQAK